MATLVVTIAVLGGCAGHDQTADTQSGPSSPAPSTTVSPPPAADDAQAVIEYLLLPDDAGMGRYAGWKQSALLDGKAQHLSLCETYDSEDIHSSAKVDIQTARAAQYSDDSSLAVITQSVVVMSNGTGVEIAQRKRDYDGACPSGNTTAVMSGFSVPQGFPYAQAFCSHPLANRPELIRCSTALGRGHVYVQIESDAHDEADAAANLSTAVALVAARLAQLPA